MPSIRCANPVCPRQGEPFYTKSSRTLYCSEACKSKAKRARSIGAPGGQRIANPVETVTRLQERFDQQEPGTPLSELEWKRGGNSITWKLSKRGRPDRVKAQVTDFGQAGRARWGVECNGTIIPASEIEASGIADPADLKAAKLVAEACVTGDLTPLVVSALHKEDTTEDAWLQLRGLLSLIESTREFR